MIVLQEVVNGRRGAYERWISVLVVQLEHEIRSQAYDHKKT